MIYVPGATYGFVIRILNIVQQVLGDHKDRVVSVNTIHSLSKKLFFTICEFCLFEIANYTSASFVSFVGGGRGGFRVHFVAKFQNTGNFELIKVDHLLINYL